jgi:ribosome-associated toxin RatA of RatAB toxin-antitoxin module
MRKLHRSAILPYPAEAMFDLVADVDSYADFVPGCIESHIDSVTAEHEVIATLGLSQSGMTGQFTTRNRLERPRQIHLTLVQGPFSELTGTWGIEPLGEAGCRLDLRMQFAFSNPMKDMVMGPLFEQICGRLVDAFVARADELYGQ